MVVLLGRDPLVLPKRDYETHCVASALKREERRKLGAMTRWNLPQLHARQFLVVHAWEKGL
jgi:hypothetical protein